MFNENSQGGNTMPKGKRKHRDASWKIPKGLRRKVIMRKNVGPYAITVIQETKDGALTEQPYVVSAIAKDLGPNQYKNPFIKRLTAKGAAIRDFHLMCDAVEEMIAIENS